MQLFFLTSYLAVVLFDQNQAHGNVIGYQVTGSYTNSRLPSRPPTTTGSSTTPVGPTPDSTTPGYTPCVAFNGNPTDMGDRTGQNDADDTGPGGAGPGVVHCELGSFCFTSWKEDPHNSSHVTIAHQGCWLGNEGHPQRHPCLSSQCVATKAYMNHSYFCCCKGGLCNSRFFPGNSSLDSANTLATNPATFAAAKESASAPLSDPSYKKKTIVVALVSVVAVSMVVAFTYLVYRLCLTPKPISPPSSSVTKVETDQEPVLPQISLEDLKVEEVIVQGRYSEVRKGWLSDKEVAVKIYQQSHRQYYYNERRAFIQPFMEHDNVVKFYGALEQTTPQATTQYLVVTELVPLGSLTSYLKHNTIDWYTLCHMCQGIAKGLAHIHTDVQKGDLFKPALAHRDVNSRNILVKADLTCVIADFGFTLGVMGSKIIKNGVVENAEQASLADVGTLRYMAPEVFDGAVNLRDCEASLKQIDMYALGLVMWEVASRCVDLYQGAPIPDYQLPFQAEAGIHPTFEEMQVLVVKYKTRPKFPDVWKESNPAVRSLKETIEDCWDTDAEARLTSLCVHKRMSDLAALWVQGAKHRGVTPTLNATMNLPGAYQSFRPNMLPSYVSTNNAANAGGEESDSVMQAPVILNSMHRRGEHSDLYNEGVTAPLITNVGQLTAIDSTDLAGGRVRSWLHDQSVSESTADTILLTTPSHEGSEPATVSAPPLKTSNVMLAMNKAIILHPNQGRNPTVERNTHKRSDEELTVSGNRLLGPGDQETDTNSPSSERRGSLGTRSAPLNHSGGGNSFDNIDMVESSSLVQNDVLSHHHGQPRNTSIPYLQNQVHVDGVTLVSAAPSLTRPKLANINGNRNFYLRLQGDEAGPRDHGKTEEVQHSLKHKLSRLIRPLGLGHKLTKMMFGGRNKKLYETGSRDDKFCGKTAGQYVTSELVASPMERRSDSLLSSLNLEVEMVNGMAVTRACNGVNSHQLNSNIMSEAQARLSATNTMRLGVLTNGDLQSPSLFPKSVTSSVSSDTKEQETGVPLQNLAPNRDYGSMHSASMNTSFDVQPVISVRRTSTPSLRGEDHARTSPHPQCLDMHPGSTPLGVAAESQVSETSRCFLASEKHWQMQRVQNKTIAPINSHHSPTTAFKISRKITASKEAPTSSHSSESQLDQDNHFLDTKGGNAIMFDVLVSEQSFSSDQRLVLLDPGSSRKSSAALSAVPQRLDKIGRDSDGELRKAAKLSQSQSVTDLGWHQRCQSENPQNGSEVWHELGEATGYHRRRPKSLSLKGHNYNHLRNEKTTSITTRCPVILAPTAIKPPPSDHITLNENGTVPLVVPNVTVNKSYPPPTVSAGSDKHGWVTAARKVASVPVSSVADTKQRSADSNSSGIRVVDGSKLEDKLKLTVSDSSEKIRRRIKTPVSFKKGRLSLYDDRLMSQSLGAEALNAVLKDDIPDTKRNSDVNLEVASEPGSSVGDYLKMIQSDSNLVL